VAAQVALRDVWGRRSVARLPAAVATGAIELVEPCCCLVLGWRWRLHVLYGHK
jgi:hypothetical protein